MFKKNDPLVGAVEKVMKENQIRRNVEAQLNESLGITSKRGLPHQYHAEYDRQLAEAVAQALAEDDMDLFDDDDKKKSKKKEKTYTLRHKTSGKEIVQNSPKHKTAPDEWKLVKEDDMSLFDDDDKKKSEKKKTYTLRHKTSGKEIVMNTPKHPNNPDEWKLVKEESEKEEADEKKAINKLGSKIDALVKSDKKVHKELDEANTPDQARAKFNKYNDKELDYMIKRSRGQTKPGDAHKAKRAGQARDAAYDIMVKDNAKNMKEEEQLDEISKKALGNNRVDGQDFKILRLKKKLSEDSLNEKSVRSTYKYLDQAKADKADAEDEREYFKSFGDNTDDEDKRIKRRAAGIKLARKKIEGTAKVKAKFEEQITLKSVLAEIESNLGEGFVDSVRKVFSAPKEPLKDLSGDIAGGGAVGGKPAPETSAPVATNGPTGNTPERNQPNKITQTSPNVADDNTKMTVTTPEKNQPTKQLGSTPVVSADLKKGTAAPAPTARDSNTRDATGTTGGNAAPAARSAAPTSNKLSPFGNAFAQARKSGQNEFEFNGKRYNTAQKGETRAQTQAALATNRARVAGAPGRLSESLMHTIRKVIKD